MTTLPLIAQRTTSPSSFALAGGPYPIDGTERFGGSFGLRRAGSLRSSQAISKRVDHEPWTAVWPPRASPFWPRAFSS